MDRANFETKLKRICEAWEVQRIGNMHNVWERGNRFPGGAYLVYQVKGRNPNEDDVHTLRRMDWYRRQMLQKKQLQECHEHNERVKANDEKRIKDSFMEVADAMRKPCQMIADEKGLRRSMFDHPTPNREFIPAVPENTTPTEQGATA